MRILLADWRLWERGTRLENRCVQLGHEVTRVHQFDLDCSPNTDAPMDWDDIKRDVETRLASYDCILLHCGDTQHFAFEVIKLASAKPLAGYGGGIVDDAIETLLRRNPRHGLYPDPIDEIPSSEFLDHIERGIATLGSGCLESESASKDAAKWFAGRDPAEEDQAQLKKLIRASNRREDDIRDLAQKLGVPLDLCTLPGLPALSKLFNTGGQR